MAICVQRHASLSKQETLLDGVDVCPLKWCICRCGLNRFVHEGMNDISNVKVHLKTRIGNVNMFICIYQTFGMIEKSQKKNRRVYKQNNLGKKCEFTVAWKSKIR